MGGGFGPLWTLPSGSATVSRHVQGVGDILLMLTILALTSKTNFIGSFDLFLSKTPLCLSAFPCPEVRTGTSTGKVLGKFLEKKVWVMYDRLIVQWKRAILFLS